MKAIITGMHRSGTSMVAGALKLCGLYFGTNLLQGLSDNPKGHFEDRTFIRLNAEIIEQNNGHWWQPPSKISKVPVPLRKKMSSFIAQWPKDRPVGWKDPRACLTIHLWSELIQPEELKAVIVLRPVEEIAMSLKKRNKFSIQKAKKLTQHYLKEVKKNTRHIPHIETQYHNYFGQWEKELTKVCTFLGLKLRNRPAIENFIDPRLCHNRISYD